MTEAPKINYDMLAPRRRIQDMLVNRDGAQVLDAVAARALDHLEQRVENLTAALNMLIAALDAGRPPKLEEWDEARKAVELSGKSR